MASTEERILRSYCSPLLSVEYDRMAQTHQTTFREAILSTIRMRGMTLMQKLSQEHQHLPVSQDPFASLLTELMPNLSPSELLVEGIKEILSSWGVVPSSIDRYREVVRMQRMQYTQTGYNHHHLSTSSAVMKRVTNAVNWNGKLRKISFSDLVLFQTSQGCYIEGTIVGEPIQPMVGGTTLIQDTKTNQVLLVCFYNVLPDGICGSAAESLLKQEFPIGATLRVAEPFFKIFGDGQRGVRVDNPSELHVITTKSSSQDAKACKEIGNDFVKKKQYMAAMDSYIKGLRSSTECDFVATILSNRAQAHIQLEDWNLAICDAAASLTIRPNSTKTWARYWKCIAKLQGRRTCITKVEMLGEAMRSGLKVIEAAWKTVDMGKAQAFKKEGNDAFQKQAFKEATSSYSKALRAGGETTRAILSNWALCALEVRNFGDGIASTIASLRIGFDAKPIFRLINLLSLTGEYGLSIQVHDSCYLPTKPKTFEDLKYQLDRCVQYQKAMITGRAESPQEAMSILKDTPHCIGNWVNGCVETFLTKDKGRGLRTIKDLDTGSVVLVEWPLVSEAFSSKSEKNLIVSNAEGSNFNVGSAASLRNLVVNRLKREATLAQIMSRMSDGTNTPGLVPISDLLVNLDLFPLLLPTHRDYCFDDDTGRKKEPNEISADRVDKILKTNCHGTSGFDSFSDCQTELYPAVSIINHSSDPNCAMVENSAKFLCIVLTRKPLRAGEELTVRYHTDEVVEKKWGIKSSS